MTRRVIFICMHMGIEKNITCRRRGYQVFLISLQETNVLLVQVSP
jgi:hypothetical protein